jgi:putative lipoprotein
MSNRSLTQTLFACALLLTMAAACAEPLDRISGSVSIHELTELPADAILTIELLDVSKADAPAERLARLSLPGGGRVLPLQFELPYYRADVQPNHRYSVRATLTSSGALLYTSTRHATVLTQGAGKRVQLELLHVQQQVQSHTMIQLENTYWKLMAIGTSPVKLQENEREPYLLLLNEHVSGDSGCNKLMGTYAQQASNELRIGPLQSTRMACLPAMAEQETALLAALARVSAYRLKGNTLELMAGNSAVLVRFTARHFK